MKTTRFDASELLDTVERRAAYISAALETGDVEEIRDAVGVVIRARGVAATALGARITRGGLYKAIGENGNPELDTFVRILASLDMRLTATPVPHKATKSNATRHKGHSRKLEHA